MTIDGIVLIILVLAALAVFLRRVVHICRYIGLGKGELATNHLGQRVRDVLVKGFGQTLVLRQPSGIFHAFIFWGFFVLSVATLEAMVAKVVPRFSFAWLGGFYWLLNTSQDIFAALVLVAVVAAVYRRVVLRPVRLEGASKEHVDAYLVLGLIALLMFAFYGMRVTAPKPGFTPVAAGLRAVVGAGAIEEDASANLYRVFAWMHHLLVLGFLVYIPYSKHLHIITALPNLFFQEERVRGRIYNLDLEDETAESFGATEITGFGKKELLDLTACTACGRCQAACPAYLTGKPLSPKNVILGLKAHLFEEGPRLVHGPSARPAKALHAGVIPDDVLWSCTTCFACEEVCPVEIQPMTKLLAVRQGRVLMKGDFPAEAQEALRNIENQSNPWGLAQEQRMEWAEGIGVKTLADDRDAEYLLFVGCAGAYDQRYIRVMRALVKVLQHAGVSFGVLGTEECCTGDSAKRIGNEYLAQMLAQQNVDTFNRYGVRKVVTACPHCFNSIKNEFPQFGGEYEVYHHTELLGKLIAKGRLKLLPDRTAPAKPATYHDSCYMSRYNDIEEPPRRILTKALGAQPVEMRRNRENGFCCGAGGGRMWMEERTGRGINVERAGEAVSSGASTVATACPFCMTMLTDGVRTLGREDVQVRDIAEVLADSLDLRQAQTSG